MMESTTLGEKILIVDDEQSIRTLLNYNLTKENYRTLLAEDGEQAIQKVLEEKPDLILLDLMLPKLDGIAVCKELRQRGIQTPLIMLTAKSDEIDKVTGLEIGADDYMTKPFSPREVIARIKAVLRRSKQVEHPSSPKLEDDGLIAGPITLYKARHEAYLHNEKLELTPKGFELLAYFIEHKNRVLSRELLLRTVWNYDFVGDTRIVDVHVSQLREKIEINSRKPAYIMTVRGIGYKFKEPEFI